MIESIRKARNFTRSAASGRRAAPRVFLPPYGGSSYFGQSYRWELVSHYKYWVAVAIRAWIHEIAGGPGPNFGKIFSKKPSKKRLKKSLGGPKAHQEFEAYDDIHPLVRLFDSPNGPDVAYDLWAYHVLFKKLTGESHWWVIRNQFNVPVEIWVIPTHWMRLVTGNEGEPIAYVVQAPWGNQQIVPYNEVVSFYEHSPLNRYEGWAVAQAISEWIDTYESVVRTWIATFKNGAVPAFHVALDETHADPDEAMLNRFYSKWFARFQGEDKAGKPLITGPGIEIKPLGIAPKDVGFETSEEKIRDNVLAAFGVPKGIVGIEPTSDTSAYAPQRQFARFSVNPELHYAGQVITEKIVRPVDPDGVCYWDDRVIDDPEMKIREIESRRNGASITPNEERAEYGHEPFPHGGDDPILNGAPVPWVTGKQQDQVLERAIESADGRLGGYTVRR